MEDKPLGIIELLQRVGEDHIRLQNMVHSLTNIRMLRGGDVKVEFVTGSQFISAGEVAAGKFRNVALLLWLDSDRVSEAQRAYRESLEVR